MKISIKTFASSLLIGLVGFSAACSKKEEKKSARPTLGQALPAAPAATPSATSLTSTVDAAQLSMFKPALPTEFAGAENELTDAKIDLGRQLYYDARLSMNHDVSCNSCHDLANYGVDNKAVSEGHKKQLGARNSPTVYNAAGQFVQFWDGRSPNVEHQATQPVQNPVEMALPDPAYAAKVLKSIPGYVSQFKKVFPGDADPVSLDNAGIAMGAFERRLVTPARWDQYLNGDESALTDEEKKGFNAFMKSGCGACHSGTLVGGTMYQKVGTIEPWPNQKDLGRFDVTEKEQDKLFFKVSSLRNVEKTAPYFHDGSVPDLATAVKMMAKHQMGKDLSDEETQAIVAWLKTLTGELPEEFIKEPELPASSPQTPKANPN